MKGAFSITTIVGLVAAFGGLATVMGLYAQGPIAEILDKGSEKVGDKTDYTIEVSSEEQLSDLAMLVYHRASNQGCAMKTLSGGSLKCTSSKHPTVCFQKKGYSTLSGSNNLGWNNETIRKNHYWPYEKGYPHLAGTYLGAQPSCPGLSAPALRNVAPGSEGNDMEGVFSREYFEVKERIHLDVNGYRQFSNGNGDHYLDYHLRAVANESFSEIAAEGCENYLTSGTKKYMMYFDSSLNVSDRVDDQRTWWYNLGVKSPYCDDMSNGINGGVGKITNTITYKGGVVLCPGDEGYIQVNKNNQDPLDEGDADAGNAKKFPYIQITDIKSNSSCSYDNKPPELNVQNIQRTNPTAGGDKLKIKVNLTNRKSAPINYNLSMLEEDGTVIAEKGTGGVSASPIQGGDWRIFTLNSKDLTPPNRRTLANMNVDDNCEIGISAYKLPNGAAKNNISVDIASYKDWNKQVSQLNEEGCLDEMARDAKITTSNPIVPSNSVRGSNGNLVIELDPVDVEQIGVIPATFHLDPIGTGVVQHSNAKKKLAPGNTHSFSTAIEINDSKGCPQTVELKTEVGRQEVFVDYANIDYSGIQSCSNGGGRNYNNGLQAN